jgi:hypothetical protein
MIRKPAPHFTVHFMSSSLGQPLLRVVILMKHPVILQLMEVRLIVAILIRNVAI